MQIPWQIVINTKTKIPDEDTWDSCLLSTVIQKAWFLKNYYNITLSNQKVWHKVTNSYWTPCCKSCSATVKLALHVLQCNSTLSAIHKSAQHMVNHSYKCWTTTGPKLIPVEHQHVSHPYLHVQPLFAAWQILYAEYILD